MTKFIALGLVALSLVTGSLLAASAIAKAGSCSSQCSTIMGSTRCTYNCY
jgi:hypothetical protein